MNFMSWASSVLDSVDDSATEKVTEIKQHIQAATPLEAATRIFGRDKETTTTTTINKTQNNVHHGTQNQDHGNNKSTDHTPPTPNSPSSTDDPPPDSTPSLAISKSPVADSSVSTAVVDSIPPTHTSSDESSVTIDETSKPTTIPDQTIKHSASVPNIPRHPKSTSIKTETRGEDQSTTTLDSSPPIPADGTNGMTADPLPTHSSSTTTNSDNPTSTSSSTQSLASSSSSSSLAALQGATDIARIASGNFFSSIMKKVSPNTSPATVTRKLDTSNSGTDQPASASAPIQPQPIATTYAPPVIAPLPSVTSNSSVPSIPSSSSFSSLTTKSSLSLDSLQSENASLKRLNSDLVDEVASLKGVWTDARNQVSKLKSLLENAKELYTNKLKDAETTHAASLKKETESFAKQLSDLQQQSVASSQTLDAHQSSVVALKLDHERDLARYEALLSESSATLEAERSKTASLQLALDDAHMKIDQQHANHIAQLASVQEESLAREQRAEETRRAHSARLDSFEAKGQQMEMHNAEYLSLLASLQRQLETAHSEIDHLKNTARIASMQQHGEQESSEHLKQRLEQAERTHSTAVDTLRQRLAHLTTENDELTHRLADAHASEQSLNARVIDLVAARDASAAESAHQVDAESASRLAELEHRVQSMAEHLLTKSQSLERATAEKTSLRMQLENESTRLTQVEIQMRSWRDRCAMLEREGGAIAGGDDSDLEHGGSSSSSSTARRVGKSATAGYGAEGERITGIQSGNAVAKAVGFMDSMGQQVAILLRSAHDTIRAYSVDKLVDRVHVAHAPCLSSLLLFLSFSFFSRYPHVRLGFGVYVVLIHLWVAVVFYHLLHEFGQETHGGEDAPINMPGMAARAP